MRRSEDLLRYLGLNTQGDLGPYTMYTDARKGLVFFLKSPPKEPPTWIQTMQRNKFRLAATLWHMLSPRERSNWEQATKSANLHIGGYNLFVYWSTTQDHETIHTVERQTAITLLYDNQPVQG